MSYRIERDTMGEVLVPEDKYWGAQTERSLNNFKIGKEKMPSAVISALAKIKLAAATVNRKLVPNKMTEHKLSLIKEAAELIISGELCDNFPLSVWQTGSGTQTNMNVNEVIAGYANKKAGVGLLHPNDDVNMSQSSNDTFPAAMHISAVCEIKSRLIPAIDKLISAFLVLEENNRDAVKCGRTHLEDAIPITFAQEISGWRASVARDKEMLEASLTTLSGLALGATAVGTGLNAPKGFAAMVAEELSQLTGIALHTEENKFHALTSRCELVYTHGAIKALAADLMKIANDIRWLASGPRCGLGEITLPENEPGSSIMPGKVNPTQCEAITMVATRVMGNDTTIGICASQGNLELNVFMPVIIYSFLNSVELLSDAILSFCDNCVSGISANRERMKHYLNTSLMTVTALTGIIGYDNAAAAVHKAHKEGITLREAVTALGIMSEDEFDKSFHPEDMV